MTTPEQRPTPKARRRAQAAPDEAQGVSPIDPPMPKPATTRPTPSWDEIPSGGGAATFAQLNVRIDAETNDLLEQVVRRTGMSKKNAVVRAIRQTYGTGAH